jgi:hypothetical protein
MTWMKSMNNKHQENGGLTGPLIFTIPASSFIVIVNFDCSMGESQQLFPTKRTVGAIWQLGRERRVISWAGSFASEGFASGYC